MNQALQKDSTLQLVAHTIVRGFDNLYMNLQKLKSKVTNEQQLKQLNNMQDKIDHLAQKTLSQSQDLRGTVQRTNVEMQIENLKRQLEMMQKKHEQLAMKQSQLQDRVSDLQCNMVTRQQFDQLKSKCQERFCLFDNRFKVIQDQNQKFFIYADQQFKRRIKPSEMFKQKLAELMQTNYRLYEYAKKLYWSIINQVLAYRALSTGLVQRGSIKTKYQQTALFKQLVNVVNAASYLIAGIPFASSVFMIVKDLASIFFSKKEEMLVDSMKIRVEGYFTEDQIAQDVARAILQLINNPYIEVRLSEFQTRGMIVSTLCKFFQFIANNSDLTPQKLADFFLQKLLRIKKQKQTQQTKYITQNVLIDTSLIMWKMSQIQPTDRRFPISNAVRSMFRDKMPKNIQYCKRQDQIPNTPENNNIPQMQNNFGRQSLPVLERNFIMEENLINNARKQQIPNKNQYMQAFSTYSKQSSSTAQSIQPMINKMTTSQTTVPQNRSNSMENIFNNMGQNYYPTYNAQRPPYFKIKIFKADLAVKKQLFGKLNVYCMIKYGNKVVKTQPIRTPDLKPVWNQQFIFQSEKIPSSISLQIYDKQRITKDEFLGSATLMDVQLDRREQQIQLWNQGKQAGTIFMCLHP